MYLFLKIVLRLFEYLRGFKLYILIILSGGHCSNIPRIGKGVTWKYPPHKKIVFGKNIFIGPYSLIDIPPKAILKIDDNTRFTFGVILAANNEIIIGKGVLVAEYSSIRDAEHLYTKDEFIINQGLKVGGIKIGKDVWIGKGSLILGSVKIGNGCIIGAHTFVKDQECSEYTIHIGTPSKFVKNR